MTLGESGENLAVLYLKRKSFRIVERNFRTKIGEIDIIAIKDNTLVFCEVKTRLNKSYGYPFESITPRKQEKIRNVAQIFLAIRGSSYKFDSVRFDVISVLSDSPSVKIDHIENAF
ncbi:MAG: YraN family protein [Actinomycetota bacterium]